MEIYTSILGSSVLLGIIIGITEVVKRAGLANNFIPLASLVIGVALTSFIAGGFNAISVLSGIIGGLAACGLWSGIKNTVQ